jgi:raffinose/stachyose/melibiose transport system substrate-binding protein
VLSARTRRFARPLAAAAALVVVVAGCSVGQIGGNSSGGDSAGTTEISFLYQNDSATQTLGKALIDGFEKENPTIKVTSETQPGGVDGDNLTKTKLSTGEMSDVFLYNPGSLFQALNPDTNLQPLTDQPWVGQMSDEMKAVVSTPKGTYGAPIGTTSSGGVLYNKKVYADLGLKVPTSWAEFRANNEKIKAAGKVTPIYQSYASAFTWTAQLFVLGDFANVAAQDPNFAANYTAGKAKYVDQPALQGFVNQQQAHDDGFFNKDYASATFDSALKAIANGTAAHYPMLTGALSTIVQNYPDKINDVGFFALPAQDAANTRATIWLPNALYVPKTTTGAKLDAAKKFLAWVNSSSGCAVQNKVASVAGPYAISSCSLPDSVPQAVKDLGVYLKDGKSGPALEFISPIKGPNLSQITVEVGSGIKTAQQGAAAYDDDVKKQAQQLGLPGW